MEVAREVAIERDEGVHKPQCRVIVRDQLKDSILIGTPEIRVAPRIAPKVDSCQGLRLRKCFVKMADAPSSDGPKFTLLNQSVPEIGAQGRSCDINSLTRPCTKTRSGQRGTHFISPLRVPATLSQLLLQKPGKQKEI
jgi:hypothetical protein